MEQNFYSKVQKIDKALNTDKLTFDLKESLFSLVKEDKQLQDYFFNNVKNIQWFNLLQEKEYFSPRKISFDNKGNAIFWNVMGYLERVSEQILQNPQYGKELIDIIEDVVRFSLNNKKINNYHIWWYCVKIINNLPANIIRDYLKVHQFRVWLDVWTDHSINVDPTILDIGEKLLPKFLQDDFSPDYQYAETIIDVITQIKPDENRYNIANRDNAVLAFDSYWVSNAFNKNAGRIGQKCSLNIIYLLADRLNDTLKFKQKYSYANIEIEDKLYQIRVARVELKAGEIRFKDEFYKCVVKEYSQEQLKNINREVDFWALHNIEPASELKLFDFKAVDKPEMVSSIQKNLPDGIEWTENKDLIKKLGNIFDGLYSDYSSIWMKSLAEGWRDHSSEAEEMLATILRDILLARQETNPQDIREVLISFLNEKYQFPIFRRFVLLFINRYWSDYFDLFYQIMGLIPDILEKSDFEVELHDILLNYNSKFSSESKAKLKAFIDNVPEYYLEKGEDLSAYWKFKWLSPLRDNPDFHTLYEDAKQKVRPKDDKPYVPKRSESQGGFVTHRSPVSKEEILKKPIEELLKYISEFKGADFWHGAFEGEPDKEGLAKALRSAVIDEPKKFTDEIDAFLDVDYFYLYRILWGLKDAWKSGKELDWKQIFDFCEKYLKKGEDRIFTEASQTQGTPSDKGINIWIVDEMVDLIREGCTNDERAFVTIYFASVDKLFDLIFPLLKGEDHPDTQKDALTYALNTTLGKTIMAYVSFSLRVARANKLTSQNWGNDKYERYFSKGIEGYIWFGYYLPQMIYLDQSYTKTKIEYFNKKSPEDFKWQMFMEGYLSGARVYRDSYILMRKNYAKVFSLGEVFDGRVEQRLVEHICNGYLHLGELLEPRNQDGEESLFWNMLTASGKFGKYDRWLQVINFFSSITRQTIRKCESDKKEDDLPEENKKKILDFWSWTFNNQEIVKENSGEKYGPFLGRMAELIILLEKIDEEKERWILLSAPYIEKEAIFFIQYLTKFEDKESIERIGRIYKAVLEHSTPEYQREYIELIVRRIYDKGDRQDAEDICNTYGRRGIHFLKPVWEEYQKDAT